MAKKETLTDDGQLEEVDMEEMKAKDKNKEMGMPSVDGEKGRADGEEDGDGGTTTVSYTHLTLPTILLV